MEVFVWLVKIYSVNDDRMKCDYASWIA